MIELPELPYAHDAFEPDISKQTFDYHYGKHYKGYIDNTNKLIVGTKFEKMNLDEIVKNSSGPIYNNAAQVWNHTFYWMCLKPNAPALDEKSSIGKAIIKQFGSVEKFKKKFIAAGTKLFGSGWVWLVQDGKELKIKQMKNADEPISKGWKPLLVCDTWEHAYYLQYQSDRARYIETFFDLINWDFVEENFK